MSFDLKTALTGLAPTLASMLDGPLAGTAITALEGAFGLQAGSGAAGITQVLQTGAMTPDIIAAVRAADQKHAEILGQQGVDIAKLNADHDAAQLVAVVDDRKDARKVNSDKGAVWWIASLTLVTFAIIMAAVLAGCFLILQGGITIKDVSVVAAVAGLVGSVVGYVAANAQTVINFIFGGSLGSEKKTDALSASVQQAIATVSRP